MSHGSRAELAVYDMFEDPFGRGSTLDALITDISFVGIGTKTLERYRLYRLCEQFTERPLGFLFLVVGYFEFLRRKVTL